MSSPVPAYLRLRQKAVYKATTWSCIIDIRRRWHTYGILLSKLQDSPRSISRFSRPLWHVIDKTKWQKRQTLMIELLFKSTQDRKIQKDILLPTDCFYYWRSYWQNNFLLFKIRFYRQNNLSSLYLTQVTFEDLPLFTSSINR